MPLGGKNYRDGVTMLHNKSKNKYDYDVKRLLSQEKISGTVKLFYPYQLNQSNDDEALYSLRN